MRILPDKGQIDNYQMTCLGVHVSSRHGLIWEIIELMNFAKDLYAQEVDDIVKGVFYDSVSNTANIGWICDPERLDPEAVEKVIDIAKDNLTQFEHKGTILGKEKWKRRHDDLESEF
jgi:hypothetical protein